MARPMTAADRAPQVGDVLNRFVSYEMPDQVVYTVAWATWHRWESTRGQEFGIYGSGHHIYVSRRDGGPVTVEED